MKSPPLKPASFNQGTRLLAVVVLFLAGGCTFALSLAPPQFGVPSVVGNLVVFRSADYRRLICVAADTGRRMWIRETEESYWGTIHATGSLLWIGRGNEIWWCDPFTGETKPGCRWNVTSLRLVGAEADAIWVAADDSVDGHFIAEIDPRSMSERWRQAEGAYLLATTADWVLVGTQKRRKEQASNPFGFIVTGASVEAFARRESKRIWSYRPPVDREQQFRWHNFHAIVAGDKVVLLGAGQTLDCLRLSDGKSLTTAHTNQAATALMHGLAFIDGKVIGCFATSEFDGSRRRFYELTLPDLIRKEFPSPPPEWTLIGISDGIGICLRREARLSNWLGYEVRTGKILWRLKHGGSNWMWNATHAGCIYVSSREDAPPASVIFRVNLRSGETKKLYRELLPR